MAHSVVCVVCRLPKKITRMPHCCRRWTKSTVAKHTEHPPARAATPASKVPATPRSRGPKTPNSGRINGLRRYRPRKPTTICSRQTKMDTWRRALEPLPMIETPDISLQVTDAKIIEAGTYFILIFLWFVRHCLK